MATLVSIIIRKACLKYAQVTAHAAILSQCCWYLTVGYSPCYFFLPLKAMQSQGFKVWIDSGCCRIIIVVVKPNHGFNRDSAIELCTAEG